jgi:uncharacterized protein YcgI (DUF1989 family)
VFSLPPEVEWVAAGDIIWLTPAGFDRSMKDELRVSASGSRAQIRESIHIEPRGWAAFKLAKEESLRLVDLEGMQVADLIAVNDADPEERSSCIFTQVATGHWRPQVGDSFHTTLCRPMLEIVEDTVGVHHVMGGYCTAESNELRYGVPDTPSCHGNFVQAVAQLGLTPDHIQPDMCASLFMNLTYSDDGSLAIREPLSRAGDFITLKARMDLRVAVSNCPQERNPCNGFRPTALRADIFAAA